jgi:hypothetical protein
MEPSSGQRDTSIAKTSATRNWPENTSVKPHQKLGPAADSASPKMPYNATIGEMNAKANANADQRENSRRSTCGSVMDELSRAHLGTAIVEREDAANPPLARHRIVRSHNESGGSDDADVTIDR